jgi:hypothetical protein
MDETNLLANDDSNEVEVDFFNVGDEVSNTTIDVSKSLGLLLSSSKADTYSSSPLLNDLFTLRNCNKLYGSSNGCKYTNNELPEFDRCVTKGCISPLRRFDNIIGHFGTYMLDDDNERYRTICFKPEILPSIEQFKESIESEIAPSLRRGKLWNLSNCQVCTQDDKNMWKYTNSTIDSKVSSALNIIAVSFPLPLSAHTQHAWFETQDSRDIMMSLDIFVQPEETTAGPGIYGTLHNNQQIDLAHEKDKMNIDEEARLRDLDVPGFLCAGHTAHTTEAGRVRRVSCGVSVRILNMKLITKVYNALKIASRFNSDKKEWILFCMGKMVYCSTKAIVAIRNFLISSSSIDTNTATMYINSEMHTAILSITSGVLLRRDSNNTVISTMSYYADSWPDDKYSVEIPTVGTPEGFKFYFSGFFQLVPYIVYDRPPRTLISSVQSIQAVTPPYGAGTSSVAPTHISKPLITTPLSEALLSSPDCKLADMVPGEDLMVAFANFNDTNEDSIMMSEGSAARGLFSHMAYSRHLISSTENIPVEGNYANIHEHRWWKSYSRREQFLYKSSKTKDDGTTIQSITAGGDGRGKVLSKSQTDTGQISVKVLRYSTPVTGDKIATGHGQKGVIKLTPDADMPWGVDDRGNTIRFDIVVSLSSISNRLTAGQYYEMVSATSAVREGKRLVVIPGDHQSGHNETELYDGKTGELIERCDADGNDVPIMASWGINRVWQMTQLTWDKQHYVHNTAGKYSINTAAGRTAGGGLRFGEMEGHATASSGLTEPYYELKSRMDCINTDFCMSCNKLVQLCSCGTNKSFVPISLPHSMLVFAYANLLTTGYITKFKLGF